MNENDHRGFKEPEPVWDMVTEDTSKSEDSTDTFADRLVRAAGGGALSPEEHEKSIDEFLARENINSEGTEATSDITPPDLGGLR